MRVIFSITDGPGPRKKFWLREHQSLTVGRTQKADFVIPEDGLISSLHFELTCDEQQCRLNDLDSTNGTFVNNERVSGLVLQDGDLVVAGRTHFTVSVEADRPREPLRSPASDTVSAPAEAPPAKSPAPPATRPSKPPQDAAPAPAPAPTSAVSPTPPATKPPAPSPQAPSPQAPSPQAGSRQAPASPPPTSRPPTAAPPETPIESSTPAAPGSSEASGEEAPSNSDIWEPLAEGERADVWEPVEPDAAQDVWEPLAPDERAAWEPPTDGGTSGEVWEPLDTPEKPEFPEEEIWEPLDGSNQNEPPPPATRDQSAPATAEPAPPAPPSPRPPAPKSSAVAPAAPLPTASAPKPESPAAAPPSADAPVAQATTAEAVIEREAAVEESFPIPELLAPRWDDEVFQQLLSDAAFLYTNRQTLLEDPTVQWLELEETEQRFEAQIGALLVGGERATAICVRQALIEAEGDPGTLYAATQVFLRNRRRDLFDLVVDRMDGDDGLQVRAVADAVRDAYPEEWVPDLEQELKGGSTRLILATSKLLGLRKLEATGDLIRAAETASVGSLPQMNWALGRQRSYDAHDVLMHSLQTHGAPDVQSSSAVAMLCLGAPHVVTECLANIGDDDWPFVPLGLGASHKATSYLINRLEANPHPDGFLALGLLGHMSAVNVLWAALADEALAQSAAEGLYLLTGAELWEEAEEPEEPADFDPAEDTVVLVTRLSQNQAHWQHWWRRNRDRFQKDKRYRYGREYSPDQLVDMLESGQTSPRLRQLAYEELVIRYNLDSPFDTELFVSNQRRALRRIDDWVRSYGSRFQPGLWYFAGQAM